MCVWSVIYHAPHRTSEFGTRPFLWWVWLHGRSPHASGIAKNTFGPVGILLFRAPQAPGNNAPRMRVKAWEDGSLRPEEICSAGATPDRATLTKTRPTEVRPKQLERRTKQRGFDQLSDAPLTCVYGGVNYVGSTTFYL